MRLRRYYLRASLERPNPVSRFVIRHIFFLPSPQVEFEDGTLSRCILVEYIVGHHMHILMRELEVDYRMMEADGVQAFKFIT